MDTVFHPGFSSSPRADMYRAWVHPDIYPNERQPVLSNWSDDELWEYCGIRCMHDNTWFDRTFCPEPCGSMHYYCYDCGEIVDDCPFFYERN